MNIPDNASKDGECSGVPDDLSSALDTEYVLSFVRLSAWRTPLSVAVIVAQADLRGNSEYDLELTMMCFVASWPQRKL